MAKRFDIKNLIAMRVALDSHNSTCDDPPISFSLNPTDHGLLRFDELWGLPVVPDSDVKVKSFRIDCASSEGSKENEFPEPLALVG